MFLVLDYSTTRGSDPPEATRFRVVQLLEEVTPTTTTSSPVTTPSTNITTPCEQDIVCLCLDVSGSMDVCKKCAKYCCILLVETKLVLKLKTKLNIY